jgi:hypothetical protein
LLTRPRENTRKMKRIRKGRASSSQNNSGCRMYKGRM